MENIAKEFNPEVLFDFVGYDVLENNNRISNSCIYEYIKKLAPQIKPFTDFTKKLFDHLGKFYNTHLQAPRKQYITFKDYILNN